MCADYQNKEASVSSQNRSVSTETSGRENSVRGRASTEEDWTGWRSCSKCGQQGLAQ
jgi:hypothetical protein